MERKIGEKFFHGNSKSVVIMELIDKSAVVAEIEQMVNEAHPNSEFSHGYITSCEKILSFLDTLEVSEKLLRKSSENPT